MLLAWSEHQSHRPDLVVLQQEQGAVELEVLEDLQAGLHAAVVVVVVEEEEGLV